MGGGVMGDQMGFEEVELTSRADCPLGSTAVKAILSNELNEWAKKEARSRDLTAASFMGELLTKALEEEQNSTRVKLTEKLVNMLGDDWADQIKQVL